MNVEDGVRGCMAGTLAIFKEGHGALLVKSYTPNSWESASPENSSVGLFHSSTNSPHSRLQWKLLVVRA
jgi:hypothetical protein